jgi:leader peptidase (prepilin peptidase) / N-methyltransferase
MATLLAIGFGLIMGSFLSVLLERLGRKEGIVAGRSECPSCEHLLAWYDLIPLGSYVMLRGRCRYCDVRISPMYPLLELTMATVMGIFVFRYGMPSTWFVVDIAVLFGLVALFFFDLRYQVLPDVLVYPLIGLTLLRLITQRPDMLVNAVATGVFVASFFGLLYAISHGRWLGFGDVKLGILIGLLFGYPGAVGVTLLAIWSGALWGLGLMATHRARLETALPFGSFWTAVAIVTLIWPGPVYFLSGLLTPYIK